MYLCLCLHLYLYFPQSSVFVVSSGLSPHFLYSITLFVFVFVFVFSPNPVLVVCRGQWPLPAAAPAPPSGNAAAAPSEKFADHREQIFRPQRTNIFKYNASQLLEYVILSTTPARHKKFGLTHYPQAAPNSISACISRPEGQKGAKDKVKRPKGPPATSRAPEGPYTSS